VAAEAKGYELLAVPKPRSGDAPPPRRPERGGAGRVARPRRADRGGERRAPESGDRGRPRAGRSAARVPVTRSAVGRGETTKGRGHAPGPWLEADLAIDRRRPRGPY